MGQSAPLTPLTLTATGWLGLNKEKEYTTLPAQWATKAQNAVFATTGALQARKGWSLLNSDSGTLPAFPIKQIFEFNPITGSNIVVSSLHNKLYKNTTTLSDITGALTPSADNWHFVNFNGSVYGLQSGHPLIKWSGTGNFAAVSAGSGTVPDGNCLLSAFGRLWGTTSDGQTLKSSTLLGDSAWTGVGTGQFTLTNVWSGQDRITALAAFNSFLVVFGERNIVIFADGSGSTLGMDPANAYVVDSISGVGCVARDSVQNVGGDDLVFLSHSGVMSLRRVIEAKGNPLRNISANIQTYISTYIASSTFGNIRSAFLPVDGLYILVLPDVSKVFCFDNKQTLDDGTWRVTEWQGVDLNGLTVASDGKTMYGTGTAKVYQYTGTNDNGANIKFIYESGWLQFDPSVDTRIKILKRLGAMFEITGSGTILFKWAFDFNKVFTTYQAGATNSSSTAQYGLAQFGLSQFGGPTGLQETEIAGSGGGQFLKIGIEADLQDASFILNLMQLFAKVGRLT